MQLRSGHDRDDTQSRCRPAGASPPRRPAGLPPQRLGSRVLVAMAMRRMRRTGSCRAPAAPIRATRPGRRQCPARVGWRRREESRPTARTGPARPTPVATPAQAPPAASAPSSANRPAASSLNLNGAPVRLEWWERLGGFLLQFRAFRILMRVRMVLTWVSLLIVAATLAVSPVARAVLGPGSVACGSWRSASGWRGAGPSPGA